MWVWGERALLPRAAFTAGGWVRERECVCVGPGPGLPVQGRGWQVPGSGHACASQSSQTHAFPPSLRTTEQSQTGSSRPSIGAWPPAPPMSRSGSRYAILRLSTDHATRALRRHARAITMRYSNHPSLLMCMCMHPTLPPSRPPTTPGVGGDHLQGRSEQRAGRHATRLGRGVWRGGEEGCV